jgi:hypothetical protein
MTRAGLDARLTQSYRAGTNGKRPGAVAPAPARTTGGFPDVG